MPTLFSARLVNVRSYLQEMIDEALDSLNDGVNENYLALKEDGDFLSAVISATTDEEVLKQRFLVAEKLLVQGKGK